MAKADGQAEQPLDVKRLLDVLAHYNVEYVVIGGVATQVHGHRRTTMDLDLTPNPDPGNLERLAAALIELKARPREVELDGAEVSVADPKRLAVAAIVPPLLTRHGQLPPLLTRYGQLHILKEPKGARAFDQLREAALVVELDGVEVAIASLDDLIRMKRAAGRPSDLDDIAALSEVERQQD